MLNWFKDKKVTKLYESDIKILEALYDDIKVLQAKHSEIYNNEEFSQTEKDTLLDLIKIQMETLRQDILIYGASMQPYFDSNIVARKVPKGVDFRDRDFLATEKATEQMLDLISPFRKDGSKASTITKVIVKKLDDRDENDKITDGKLEIISKVNFKPELKEKLKAMHEKSKVTRKKNLVKYINKVKPGNDQLQREHDIIKEVVLHTLEARNSYNHGKMITDISEQVMSVEDSLRRDSIYKTFLDITNIENMSFNSHLPQGLVQELRAGWLSSLRETNDFVFVKAQLSKSGSRGTGSSGPR